jgi:uncharacterized protein DUF3105
VSSRKEQKERLRRERLERERAAKEAERRKRMVGYGVGGALAIAGLAVVAVLALTGGSGTASTEVYPDGGSVPDQKTSDLSAAMKAAGCKLTTEKSDSREHTTDIKQAVKYRTNPPTDGKHYFQPAKDGAYDNPPPDQQLVHNLEHGRVVVWFKRSLPKNARANIKAFFDEDTFQMVLAPRQNMPYQIAASAWNRDPTPNGTGRLMSCARYTPAVFDALRAFREANRSNGPEPVP